jgi:hypothetical protein
MLSKPYIFGKELKTMGFGYASWGIKFPFSYMVASFWSIQEE